MMITGVLIVVGVAVGVIVGVVGCCIYIASAFWN